MEIQFGNLITFEEAANALSFSSQELAIAVEKELIPIIRFGSVADCFTKEYVHSLSDTLTIGTMIGLPKFDAYACELFYLADLWNAYEPGPLQDKARGIVQDRCTSLLANGKITTWSELRRQEMPLPNGPNYWLEKKSVMAFLIGETCYLSTAYAQRLAELYTGPTMSEFSRQTGIGYANIRRRPDSQFMFFKMPDGRYRLAPGSKNVDHLVRYTHAAVELKIKRRSLYEAIQHGLIDSVFVFGVRMIEKTALAALKERFCSPNEGFEWLPSTVSAQLIPVRKVATLCRRDPSSIHKWAKMNLMPWYERGVGTEKNIKEIPEAYILGLLRYAERNYLSINPGTLTLYKQTCIEVQTIV